MLSTHMHMPHTLGAWKVVKWKEGISAVISKIHSGHSLIFFINNNINNDDDDDNKVPSRC